MNASTGVSTHAHVHSPLRQLPATGTPCTRGPERLRSACAHVSFSLLKKKKWLFYTPLECEAPGPQLQGARVGKAL